MEALNLNHNAHPPAAADRVSPPRADPPPSERAPSAEVLGTDKITNKVNHREQTVRAQKLVADRALEHPPEDIARLSASLSKLMLTDLGPALKLAESIRDQVQAQSPVLIESLASSDRREVAISLLSLE